MKTKVLIDRLERYRGALVLYKKMMGWEDIREESNRVEAALHELESRLKRDPVSSIPVKVNATLAKD